MQYVWSSLCIQVWLHCCRNNHWQHRAGNDPAGKGFCVVPREVQGELVSVYVCARVCVCTCVHSCALLGVISRECYVPLLNTANPFIVKQSFPMRISVNISCGMPVVWLVDNLSTRVFQTTCVFSVSSSCSSSQAIVFRPFKGEVLDAVVTQVNKVSLSQLFSVTLYPSPAYMSVVVCMLARNTSGTH